MRRILLTESRVAGYSRSPEASQSGHAASAPPPSSSLRRTKIEPLLPRPSRTLSLRYVVSSHDASSAPERKAAGRRASAQAPSGLPCPTRPKEIHLENLERSPGKHRLVGVSVCDAPAWPSPLLARVHPRRLVSGSSSPLCPSLSPAVGEGRVDRPRESKDPTRAEQPPAAALGEHLERVEGHRRTRAGRGRRRGLKRA